MLTATLLALVICANAEPSDFAFNRLSSGVYQRVHAVVGVDDEYLVVLGGQENQTSTREDFVIYLKNYTISETGTNLDRTYACSAQQPGTNTLWIFGGVLSVPNSDALLKFDLQTYNVTVQSSTSVPAETIGCACGVTTSDFYVFGGCSGNLITSSNAVYKYNGSDWEIVMPKSDTVPPNRSFSSLVIFTDSNGHENLVVFGGMNQNSTSLNDTWCFNLNTQLWSQFTTTGPSARLWHSAVINTIHPKPQMIVFGGYNSVSPFNDVWLCDLESGSWSQVTPQSEWPNPRYGHVSVFHRGRMLTFGGTNGTDLGDLWQFVPQVDCSSKEECSDCVSISGCGWCAMGRTTTCVSGDDVSGLYIADSCTPESFDSTDEACKPLPLDFDGWWIVLGVIGLFLVAGVVLFLVKSMCDPCPPEYEQIK